MPSTHTLLLQVIGREREGRREGREGGRERGGRERKEEEGGWRVRGRKET